MSLILSGLTFIATGNTIRPRPEAIISESDSHVWSAYITRVRRRRRQRGWFQRHGYLTAGMRTFGAFHQPVLQLRNPFDAIFLSFAKPSESTGGVLIKGPFVKPRLSRGVGLCVHATVRHNKVRAHVSCNPRLPSSFSPFRRSGHDDTLHFVCPRGRNGRKQWETEEGIRKAAGGNISTNPRAHTRRSFCENSSPRAVYFVKTWERRDGENAYTWRNSSPTGRACYNTWRVSNTHGTDPHSRHGTKCPLTAETHSAQWMHLLFIVRKW